MRCFMKKILIFIVFFIIFGCSSKKEITQEEKILIGKIERSTLSNPDFPWYQRNYQNYNVQDSIINKLKVDFSQIYCKIFLGTWCSDSKREVPRILKIFDLISFKNYEIIGLGRDKKSSGGEERELNIQKVPTIIFYKNEKEIGRIIETPTKTLEEDILDILSK